MVHVNIGGYEKASKKKRENLRKIPLEKLAGTDFEVTYV